MTNILKYDNRDQLYIFLIQQFGLAKLEEHYYPEKFGNFYITLSGNKFLVRYVNDRSYLTIQIASCVEPSKWYDLSFIMNYIYQPENINPDGPLLSNEERINALNAFLKKDFNLIGDLFSSDNYFDTRQKIDRLLKEQFNERFPSQNKS